MASPEKTQLRAPQTTWWDRVWSPFWVLPAFMVIASFGLGYWLPRLDEAAALQLPYLFQGGPDGARSVLSAIASAMVTVVSLVFSVTMVVLQLASSQFTPRVIGGFLESRIVQATLGVFLSAFVYSLTVLRLVRDGDPGFVPQMSVTVAFLLVLASIALLLAFIGKITGMIQVTHVVSRIGDNTSHVLDSYFPTTTEDTTPQPEDPPYVVGTAPVERRLSERHGYVTDIDLEGLTHAARQAGVCVELAITHGDFLVAGQVLGRVHVPADVDLGDECDLNDHIHLGTERTLRADPSFGLRQITDIALRALSPGVNDPTTAIECIQEFLRILRPVVGRPDPSSHLTDDQGEVRVIWRPQLLCEVTSECFLEIIEVGKETHTVMTALADICARLAEVATDRNREALLAVREQTGVTPVDGSGRNRA